MAHILSPLAGLIAFRRKKHTWQRFSQSLVSVPKVRISTRKMPARNCFQSEGASTSLLRTRYSPRRRFRRVATCSSLKDTSCFSPPRLAISYCQFFNEVYLETESTAGLLNSLLDLQDNVKFWDLMQFFVDTVNEYIMAMNRSNKDR